MSTPYMKIQPGRFARPRRPAVSAPGPDPIDTGPEIPGGKTVLTEADWKRVQDIIKQAVGGSLTSGGVRATPPRMGDGDPPRMMTAPLNPNRPDTPNNDFIHGVKGKLKYGTTSGGTTTYTEFYIEQISIDDDVDTDDITNSSSGGGQVMLDGIQKITGTITFVYDSLNCFLVAPLPFRPRTYALLQVMPDGVTIGAQFCALMNGYSYGTGPKAGTVRVACKYMSTGPITYPTASATVPTPALTS